MNSCPTRSQGTKITASVHEEIHHFKIVHAWSSLQFGVETKNKNERTTEAKKNETFAEQKRTHTQAEAQNRYGHLVLG